MFSADCTMTTRVLEKVKWLCFITSRLIVCHTGISEFYEFAAIKKPLKFQNNYFECLRRIILHYFTNFHKSESPVRYIFLTEK